MTYLYKISLEQLPRKMCESSSRHNSARLHERRTLHYIRERSDLLQRVRERRKFIQDRPRQDTEGAHIEGFRYHGARIRSQTQSLLRY